MLAVVLAYAPMQYEINDDIVIKNILSGEDGYPADFSSATHVVSQVLSYLLYYLYAAFPAVPWFPLTIFLESYLGIAITLSVFLKRILQRKSVLYPLLLLPALLVFLLSSLTHITFTSAALLLEFGVLLVLLERVAGENSLSESAPVREYLLVVCLLMSFFLRWQVFLSSLIFGAPILLFTRKYHIKRLLLLAFILFVAFAGDRTMCFFNDTPHHDEFLTFNKMRSNFQDNIGGEYFGSITQEAARNAGWSMNDYWFFRTWITYDNELFNTERLRTFLKENSLFHSRGFLEIVLKRIAASAKANSHYVLLFVFTLLSLICCRLRPFLALGHKEKTKILLSLGFLGLGILFLMYYRFPSRIYMPLFVFTIGSVFLFFDIERVSRPRNALLTAASLIFFVFAVSEGYAQGKINLRSLEYSQTENSYVKGCLEEVRIRYGDPLLLQLFPTFSHGIGIERIHPLRRSTDFTIDNRIFYNPVNSPRYYALLQQYGLRDGNAFLQWTINNEQVLFVFFDRGGEIEEFIRKLWELYYDTHISPTRPVSLERVADFRDVNGIGLVFCRMASR